MEVIGITIGFYFSSLYQISKLTIQYTIRRYSYRYSTSEDSPSEMLRFIMTSAVNVLRNRPGFSLM